MSKSLQSLETAAREAVQRLYHWQTGGTNFTSHLYELMSKADPENLSKLATVYPMEACALIAWRNCVDSNKFFQAHGVYLGQGIA